MFCGKCGKEIPSNCEFCMNCGTKVSATDAVENVLNIEENNPKKKNIKKVVVAAVVALLAVLAVIIGLYIVPKPADYMRGSSWGDSMEKVKKAEHVELKLKEKDPDDEKRDREMAEMLDLPYIEDEHLQAQLTDFEMLDESNELSLSYRFVENKLVSISIMALYPDNKTEKLVEKYVEKYGEAEEEDLPYMYSYTWEDKDTQIEISSMLIADKYELLSIEFEDINYEE